MTLFIPLTNENGVLSDLKHQTSGLFCTLTLPHKPRSSESKYIDCIYYITQYQI